MTEHNLETPAARGEVALILAAAGSGSRFGGELPKQFLTWSGRKLYRAALEPFLGIVNEAVVVVPEEWIDLVRGEVADEERSRLRVVPGGESRQASVERGLEAISGSPSLVLVHDAARPFVSQELVGRVIDGTRRFGACIPGLVPADTVKLIDREKVVRTLPREEIRLAQTPQGFDRELLARALANARTQGFNGTDEASVVERLGVAVHFVDGDPANVKVTWQRDLAGDRTGGSGKEIG